MLRIALPNKGRLSSDSRELLTDAGLDVRVAGERALIATVGESFEAILVRAQDIAEFVADGAADAGITGLDLVEESGRELVELLDLRFGRCRIVIAARDDSGLRSLDDIRDAPRIATVFPRITERFFAARACPVTIVPVSGATEVAPHLGIADVVVDLTSTGSTLRVNGLHEIGTVMESTARLFAAPGALRDAGRKAELEELTTALESVLNARGRRYVMANVPRGVLEDVRRVLPGINGPTVVDILDSDDLVAVHAVVAASAVYRTIGALRALGARGILVTRIERLTP